MKSAILFLPVAAALPQEITDLANFVNEAEASYNKIETLDVWDLVRGPVNGMGGRRLVDFDFGDFDLDAAKDSVAEKFPDFDEDKLSEYKEAASAALAECEALDFSAVKPVVELLSAFVEDTKCAEQVMALALTVGIGNGNAMSAACGISNECILTYGVAGQGLATIAADSFEPDLAAQLQAIGEADLEKLVKAKSLVCTFIPAGDAASVADTIDQLREKMPQVVLPQVEGFAETADWMNNDQVLELIALCPALKDSAKVEELLAGFDFSEYKVDYPEGAGAAAANLAEAIEEARRGEAADMLPDDVKALLDEKLNEVIAVLDASEVAKLFEKCKDSDVELSSSRIVLTEAQTAKLTTEQVTAFETTQGGNGAARGSLCASALVAAALGLAAQRA